MSWLYARGVRKDAAASCKWKTVFSSTTLSGGVIVFTNHDWLATCPGIYLVCFRKLRCSTLPTFLTVNTIWSPTGQLDLQGSSAITSILPQHLCNTEGMSYCASVKETKGRWGFVAECSSASFWNATSSKILSGNDELKISFPTKGREIPVFHKPLESKSWMPSEAKDVQSVNYRLSLLTQHSCPGILMSPVEINRLTESQVLL